MNWLAWYLAGSLPVALAVGACLGADRRTRRPSNHPVMRLPVPSPSSRLAATDATAGDASPRLDASPALSQGDDQ